MECIEALKTRRSIRKFTDEQIPKSILMDILDAGRLAPTAGNCQPWQFIVVNERSVIAELKNAAFGQELLDSAATVIIVCADPQKSEKYGEMGMTYYCLLDCANAAQNILLAAHALGYGGCWMGGFSERRVKKALEIPEEIRVVSMIPLGRPEGDPMIVPKMELQDLLRFNKW